VAAIRSIRPDLRGTLKATCASRPWRAALLHAVPPAIAQSIDESTLTAALVPPTIRSMTMNRRFGHALCLAVLASVPGCAATAAKPSGPLAATVVPVPSQEDRAAAAGWGEGNWMDQHEAINRIGDERHLDLVFLGDSITQSWGGAGRTVGAPAAAVWTDCIAHLNAANFGISGDRTQHLLWRIDHGNFDAIAPRVIVLMVGTNNLRHDAPADIAAGVEAIIGRLAVKAPGATVLLMSIVRGWSPDDSLRTAADETNRQLESLDAHHAVRFIDLTSRFYDDEGEANTNLMRGDFVHFSAAGYRAWFDALEPHLTDLLGVEIRCLQ
jgi:lysophospholipase L1-like esterase